MASCFEANRLITVILFISIMSIVSAHITIINSTSNNGLWLDDFVYGHFGIVNGWSNNLTHLDTTVIPNKQYHGRFTDVDTDINTIMSNILLRTFRCSSRSNIFLSYSAAFDCGTEPNQADGVAFYFNGSLQALRLTPGDAKNSGEPTIPVSSLPDYLGQCAASNKPWDVIHSGLMDLGIIQSTHVFELKWIAEATHLNDGIVIYNIQVSCEKYTTINPTFYPTNNPTYDPTTNPTFDPTNDPTADPTNDPTQYPTFDPTNDPTADPTTDPTNDPTADPSTDPTFDPTADPTYDPTHDPTMDPTHDPTQDPTYDPIGNITYGWETTVTDKGVMGGGLFIHDSYSKFEATITMDLNLLKSLNRLRWEYVDWNAPNLTNNTNWTEISKEYYKNINIYTAQVTDVYKLKDLGFAADDLVYSSVLTISAIRVLNSGYCYNTTTAKKHLLQPGKHYGFRLFIVADSLINDRYDEYFYSDVMNLTTNQFVTGGQCILQLLDKTSTTARLLDKFYFDCTGWSDPDSLTQNFSLRFNGLMNDVLINNALLSESWSKVPASIIGVIGTKALKITALMRDDLGAITCYPINIDDSFPSASLSDEEILAAIRRIIRENKLGEDNAIAVALDTILEGLLYIGYANNTVLSQIMDLIVSNVVDTSYATDPAQTSSGRVLSESILMKGLLSENRLIFPNSASLIVDAYLPQLYSTIDQEIITAPAIQLDQSIGDSLNQIGLKSLDLADKLESFMTKSSELKDFDLNHNQVLESFVEFSAYSGHIALAQSYPGAVFEYFDEAAGKNIFTKKIDPHTTDSATAQECGIADGNNIRIPPIFDTFYDCSFVDQSDAYFEPNDDIQKMEESRTNTLSKTVTINLYNGSVYNSVFDVRRRRMIEDHKRRRLQGEVIDLSNSLLASTQIEDRCQPYFIHINLNQNDADLYTLPDRLSNSYALGENTPYPACTFWNTVTKEWDKDNCFVYNYTESEVLCACLHLTTFNIKASDFKPEANVVTWYDFRSLNKKTLLQYPFVWITLVAILCLFVLICIIDAFVRNKKDNLSPLAYRDIMFTAVRDHKMQSYLPSTTAQIFEKLYSEKHKHYGVGLIKSIRKDNRLCTNQLRLYKIYLEDNHTLLSVFQHSEGTGYTKRERIASFYLYLSTIMVSSAVFYGVEQQRFGDITASFLVSLWSTIPALIARFSFKKAKPNIVDITINIDGVSEAKLNKIDLSKLPTNAEDNELREGDVKRYNEIYDKLEADSQFKYVDKSMMDEIYEIIIRANDKLFRMRFLDYTRCKLLKKDHSWPHFMKYVGWIFLILWCCGCSILAIVYGIQFDLLYKTQETNAFTEEGYNEECYDMNPQLLINEELSDQQIEENEANLNNNFGAHVGDSSSWLIQLFQSVFLSIFVWQPLTIYFITWLNIWLFSWNLPITLKPPNLIKLLKNVIGIQPKQGSDSGDEANLAEVIELQVVATKSYSILPSRSTKTGTNTPRININDIPYSPNSSSNKSPFVPVLDEKRSTSRSKTIDLGVTAGKSNNIPIAKKKNKKKNVKFANIDNEITNKKKKRSKSIAFAEGSKKKKKQKTANNKTKKRSKSIASDKNIKNKTKKKRNTPKKKQGSNTMVSEEKEEKTEPDHRRKSRKTRDLKPDKIFIKNTRPKLKRQRSKSMVTKPLKKTRIKSIQKKAINKKKKKKKAKTTEDIGPFAGFSLDLAFASKTIVDDTMIRYKKNVGISPHSEDSLGDITDQSAQKTPNTATPKSFFTPISPKKTGKRSISQFSVAVEKCINISEKKKENDFEDLYKNIVSHQFRPFDVYAYFGTKRYFLDIVATWYGLDIAGYEKPEPVVQIEEDKQVQVDTKKEEIHKKKVQPWASAVSYM